MKNQDLHTISNMTFWALFCIILYYVNKSGYYEWQQGEILYHGLSFCCIPYRKKNKTKQYNKKIKAFESFSVCNLMLITIHEVT